MASLNKITIIGFVASEPEMRFTPNGSALTSFSLAASRHYTSNDERKEETEWFTVVAWNKLGETCNQYVEWGMQVYVEGRVQLRKWESQDGKERSKLEIVATTVLFLGKKEKKAEEEELEDIPF